MNYNIPDLLFYLKTKNILVSKYLNYENLIIKTYETTNCADIILEFSFYDISIIDNYLQNNYIDPSKFYINQTDFLKFYRNLKIKQLSNVR